MPQGNAKVKIYTRRTEDGKWNKEKPAVMVESTDASTITFLRITRVQRNQKKETGTQRRPPLERRGWVGKNKGNAGVEDEVD